MKRLSLVALLLLLCAVAAQAQGTLAGITLPNTIDVGGQSLVLNGMGLRKKFFIKVYVGGLYLSTKDTSAEKVLAADAPRQMVLVFLYGVSKTQMCEQWLEGPRRQPARGNE